jgi:hypothetical protein
MIVPTYRWGYGTSRLTIRQLRQQSTFALLDPEFQRRVIALMRAGRRAGHDIGVGGAARTTAQQTALFLSRHHEVPSGGCCTLNGKRYALTAGKAHAAPPGRSYHEPTTPAGKALAVDMVGWEDGWMTTQLPRYGLRDIPGEKWHLQPAEVAGARSQYRGPHPLPKWRFA